MLSHLFNSLFISKAPRLRELENENKHTSIMYLMLLLACVMLVCGDEDHTIGTVTYDPATCRITYLFVKQSHRKSGYGRKLVDMALAKMKDNGCDYVSVTSSTEAAPFYRALGFRAVTTFDRLFGRAARGTTYIVPVGDQFQ
jgi:ribosomal protein S18 acetylase RimI-like enzyme